MFLFCSFNNIVCKSLIDFVLSFNKLLIQNIGQGSTFLFNRALWDFIINTTKIENILAHDWWIMLNAAAFGKISYVSIPTMLYRQHFNNIVGSGKYSLSKGIIKLLFSFREIKHEIIKTQRQVYAFHSQYSEILNIQQNNVLKNYYEINNKPFIFRKFFVIKNRFKVVNCTPNQ